MQRVFHVFVTFAIKIKTTDNMRKSVLWLAMATACLLAGCGGKPSPSEQPDGNVGTSTKIEGDSTRYGLACEGCTDSVLVFLPGTGGDPVTYDIVDAFMHSRVIGRPKTGDWVAVVLNGEDSLKADMVINLDELKGQWVQWVAPTLRKKPMAEGLTEEVQEEIDSLLRERLKPVEIGFALKRHYAAQPIGLLHSLSSSDDDPVEFPIPKRYSEWHVFNGRLILKIRPTKEDSLKNRLEIGDTAEFLLLSRDSLRLRFKDGEKGYSRKNGQ